jgi:hypothetical protein
MELKTQRLLNSQASTGLNWNPTRSRLILLKSVTQNRTNQTTRWLLEIYSTSELDLARINAMAKKSPNFLHHVLQLSGTQTTVR